MTDEINREVLLIYLSNLRTMELIIHKSQEQITKLKDREVQSRKYLDELLSTVIEKPQPPIRPETLTVSSFLRVMVVYLG